MGEAMGREVYVGHSAGLAKVLSDKMDARL